MPDQRTFAFAESQEPPATSTTPTGYKGFYGFHKYWGKKPHEPLAHIIELLTERGDIVLDPFVGSGTAGRESLLHGRRFVGIDINPVAVDLSRILLKPPDPRDLKAAFRDVQAAVKDEILSSYILQDEYTVATHFLWDASKLAKVWVAGRSREKNRKELEPTPHDLDLIASFADYDCKNVRAPRFFSNGRINASPRMTLDDLFTNRAQRNLDLLIGAIRNCPEHIRQSLLLCLTAASGQMTKMVFAVTGRGKTDGKQSTKTEVGSWVIGYWRPKLHFEVNAWNCFDRRANKLIRAISSGDPLRSTRLSENIDTVLAKQANAVLQCGDCRELLRELPDESIHLVLTDPPHSDRIPYLELSELWNSILGHDVDFSRELVMSNAKERSKDADAFTSGLKCLFDDITRVLTPNGFCVVIYNARQREAWDAFSSTLAADGGRIPLAYVGCFPFEYSAGSVVQDNRGGSLKSDFAVVMRKASSTNPADPLIETLAEVPGWTHELPPHVGSIESI